MKAPKFSCPKCGPQYPLVLGSSIGLKVKDDFWICSMNMPYQGCGLRLGLYVPVTKYQSKKRST